MKFSALATSCILVASSVSASPAEAKGAVRSDLVVKYSAQEHYQKGMELMKEHNFKAALKDFMTVTYHFPQEEVAEDAFYFQAVCQYNLMDYDIANKLLSDYLNQKLRLRYFEDALNYKLAIADKFKEGARKHLFESEKMPKWSSAREDALAIYDELTTMVPNHDVAAKAFLGKATLQQRIGEGKDAIETFKSLIKRFPKHPHASDAYLALGEIYFAQSHTEFLDPDLLELSRLNLQRFKKAFPRDPKLEKAKEYLTDLEEMHAKKLYETGLFYERTKKPKASVIYYVTAIEKFPDSHASTLCKKRLNNLSDEVAELQVSPELIQ